MNAATVPPGPAASRPRLSPKSRYIWVPGLETGRNLFVGFELRFVLPGPAAAVLHLFADTRYRLFVNEVFVAYGPGRFVTAHPEFDTHDLAALLQAGENVLRVEVNHYGCASFQSMPDGQPGFLAGGGLSDGSIDFSTPGAWLARVHRAWDADAPHFSFAQNPAEICDTRVLAGELAQPAPIVPEALAGPRSPWPHPEPRSAPMPDYTPQAPARILVAGPVAPSLRWGFQTRRPDAVHSVAKATSRCMTFCTWIHSPRDQEVVLECFWTHAELDGRPVAINSPGHLGNHGEALVQLHAGWNFLSGNFQLLLEYWAFLIGLPCGSGASLHALPDLACEHAFAVSPLSDTREIAPPPASPETYAPPPDWTLVSSDLARVTPARLVAWDSPAPATARHDLPFAHLDQVSRIVSRAAVWSFDFGDEYYGHPVIEVEAPEGSVLDIAYDDWKRADGCVNLYHSNPFTDAADRFILRGGRQRIEVLNPRGGIYLQVVLRVPPGSPPVELTVHDLAVRRRTTLNACAGSFSCGDPVLDWAWRAGTHTLQASTDEAYADCPWRERGSYIGDSVVNFHLHRFITADYSVARRTLETFAHAQLPDGQLACCAPSWLTKPHEDFTLLWITAVRDLWAHTGDLAFARRQLPVIRRILGGSSWRADADGLWDATGKGLFIDWGVVPAERSGAGNAVLNLCRVGALRAASELARATGHESDAEAWTTESTLVVATLLARVWHETEGRFRPGIDADSPALHANILALYHGVGPADHLLAYLEPRLRSNFTRGLAGDHSEGVAELYFFHYLLPALVARGRADLAEDLVRETYGHVKSLGYPTLPECFHRAHEGRGSCCHSWSGAPAIYAVEHVLGLRLARPGHPDGWLLDPAPTGHARAKGSVPHPRGLITAAWSRRPDGRIFAEVSAPRGVTVTPAPHVVIVAAHAGALAGLAAQTS